MLVAAQPNVILVMTDDQGYGDMSCHGNPVVQTPNLDQLHALSTRLVDFHVDPYCSPTRAALLTGRYSARGNVYNTLAGRCYLHQDEITMAQTFADSGYRCGHFGKWHLGHNYPFAPHHRGFHESLMLGDGGLGATNDYWGNDRFDDVYFRNGEPEQTQGFGTDVFFAAALDFIRRNRDRPFFVYLATNEPHEPWNVPPQYSDRYREFCAHEMHRLYGTIDKIDENLGRLLQFLAAEGLADNTILIFLTDNGTVSHGYQGGMRGRKGSEYDGGHRVPCFIRWPGGGIPAGRDVTTITAHVDLLPTLIELCGLKPKQSIAFDGMSLVPLLRGARDDWPARTLCVHAQQPGLPFHLRPQKWYRFAVLTDRWRLVNGTELYDMRADPLQQVNLAPQHTEVVARLRSTYDTWFDEVTKRSAEFCEVILGAPGHDRAWLTMINVTPADGERFAWSQQSARHAFPINGFWAVEIARAGTYEFELRRWPREVNLPFHAVPDHDAKRITPTRARLTIAGADVIRPVDPTTVAVTIQLRLEPGHTRLQTWLIDDDGTQRTAYWVYVTWLDKP
ncbi:MAG: hypothetical protein A2W31_14015 [Planctomycetes bacterium RBG_16_64_10]|nr:MAG: hypothetical protein A2W31_14015 [Planctomycetes bacterium RBG_16_64_10]